MNRLLGLGTFAVLLVALTAVAADDKLKPKPKDDKATFESVTKDMIDILNKMTTVLESAKDDATAKTAKPKLVKFAEQMQELAEKAKNLGAIPPDVEKKLEEKFKLDLDTVTKRLIAEKVRLDGHPFGKELIDALKPKAAAAPKAADKPAAKPPEK